MLVNKYDKPMMTSAVAFAEMSTATRNKVGCVIAHENRPIAVGYNGTLSGLDNKCEEVCSKCQGKGTWAVARKVPGNDDYTAVQITCEACQGKGETTSEFVIHAEQNAISYCAKHGIPIDGTTLYMTLSPCKTCAKMIAACGIVRVVYKSIYRDDGGIQYLEKCNIKTEKYND